MQAILAADVTHAHPEGSLARSRSRSPRRGLPLAREPRATEPDLLRALLPRIPDSKVRAKISRRATFAEHGGRTCCGQLGNGGRSRPDTVPFCLWCAAKYLDNYEEAMWATVSALGDRDTTCAIVGGIVACYTGVEGIPPDWLAAREPLPDWILA